MSEGMAAELAQPAIDRATLLPVVRRAAGRATAEIASWEVVPTGGGRANPATGGLHRVHGTAVEGGGTFTWSLVLKICRDPGRSMGLRYDDVRAVNYWRREFLAYASGVLDRLPPGLRAPRCHGATEAGDGTAWLWLEELADTYSVPWPVERYGLAARHVGQLNGAYLGLRPLPDVPWLSRRGAEWQFELTGPHLERVAKLDHPLVRREFPEPKLAERSLQLWRDRGLFYTTLARLPQTLCHLDLFRDNLFGTRGPAGAEETVAVDWAWMGLAPLGAEIVPLVTASVFFAGEHADRVPELGEVAFEGYLAGLRDAGWTGDARLARLGYATGMIRYAGAFAPLVIDMPDAMERAERTWGPIEEILDRWVCVRRYSLELTDEARALMAARVVG